MSLHQVFNEITPVKTNAMNDANLTNTSEKSSFLNDFKIEENWQPPRLPVLEIIEAKENSLDLSQYLFVLGQHCLNTTASLVNALLKHNAKSNHIFLVGKIYSNNAKTIEWLSKKITYVSNTPMEILGEFNLSYSTSCHILWSTVTQFIQTSKISFKGIIVLDDGGAVLDTTPAKIRNELFYKRIIGIEQTSSGLDVIGRLQYPVIALAACTIKNEIEPSMVADVISKKAVSCIQSLKTLQLGSESSSQVKETYTKLLALLSPQNKTIIGIIGAGHIGLAVLQKLIIDNNYANFIVYDTNYKNAEKATMLQTSSIYICSVKNLENLICNAHIIIGCTGKDVTVNMEESFYLSSTPKLLFSCSSKDTEFNSLLVYIRTRIKRAEPFNPLDNVLYISELNSPILILRGGFPINFDNSERSVLEQDIQLIRCLKFEAILQAIEILDFWQQNPSEYTIYNFMLDPNRQKYVMDLWVEMKQSSQSEFYALAYKRYCDNPDYIQQNSSGVFFKPKAKEIISNTNKNSNETITLKN